MTRKKTWKERRPIPVCEVGVLHLFGPGFLHAPNRMLEFKGSGERQLRVPLRGLRLVCLYGSVRVTAGAVRLITDAGAALAYFSASGSKSNGILSPANDQWRGRRFRQYQVSSDRKWLLNQSRKLIEEKIESIIDTVKFLQRKATQPASVRTLLPQLRSLKNKALSSPNHDSLRGIEGVATRFWYGALSHFLPEPWSFPGRRKRPPTDPVNALLSLGYTLLFHRVQAACQAWGLDPVIGVFHEFRPGRSSLACDFSEPFRTPVVDKTLIQSLWNEKIKLSDFQQDPSTMAVTLSDEAWKQWLGLLETEIHKSDNERCSIQSQIVSRVGQLAEELPVWNGEWPAREDLTPHPDSVL